MENKLLIILDLGANDGCSILKFKDLIKKEKIDNYKIYSFEPNPFFEEKLKNATKNDKNVIFINKIIGTKNDKTKLFLSQKGNDGSSIYGDKKTRNINKNVFVICEEVDIVEFINNLPEHNKLWIKMDIEGAEYNIIPHMYKHNCIDKMDRLFIEWHFKKLPSITKEFHESTVKLVNNIKCDYWGAEDYRDMTDAYHNEYQMFLKNLNK